MIDGHVKLALGDIVMCRGEADTRFVVEQLRVDAAYLRKEDGSRGYKGMGHGWEMLSKLRRPESEAV